MAPLMLTCLASFISSFLIMTPSASAMVRIQAAPPTPIASLIMNGISPRPTDPPGSNGVPRELLRRAAGIQFPPPPNWCGFVQGSYNNPLSCTNSQYTCIFSGPVAVGCCANLNGACSALYTDCMDYTANWAPYKSDTSRIICSNPSLRYCASFAFPQGHKLFYCESTAFAMSTVEFLNDYYYTAIGSTVGPSSNNPSTTSAPHSPTNSAISSISVISTISVTSITSTTDSTSTNSRNPSATIIPIPITTTPDKNKISTGAIAGIGAGVGLLLLAAIAALIFFACMRKRKPKPNQVTTAQPPPTTFNNNAPMQQQDYMAPPYQNPSQPNAQYPESQTAFLKDSKSPYESTSASTYGQPSPMSPPLLLHGDPNNRASTVSPPLSHNPSVVENMRPLSSNLPVTGGADVQRINSLEYYKHPSGPISEVDGTGLQPQIFEAASVPVHAAQENGQGQQYPPGALNTQTYAGQAPAAPPKVHEAPAQQEPRYVPYSPVIATPPPQQYSSQQQYPTNNQQPAQGAPVGQQRPAASSAGPWEIGP